MPFEIDSAVIDEIIRDAKVRAPLEACGYLGGVGARAVAAYPLVNADASREHFSFIPEEQFATVRKLRSKKLKPLAVYHSHPESPARPSAEDLRLANDASLWYVIISLAGAVPVVKSFRIVNGEVAEEMLHAVKEQEE